MLIEGKFSLKAPIQKIFDTMQEADTLASCIPGAEKVEKIDEKTYDCIIKQSVGPFSVKLKFKVVLTELKPPNFIKASGNGEALGKMGTFIGEIEANFTELQNGEVEVAYKTNVNITGKLATFGDRIMRAKAKSMEADITKNLQAKLISKTA